MGKVFLQTKIKYLFPYILSITIDCYYSVVGITYQSINQFQNNIRAIYKRKIMYFVHCRLFMKLQQFEVTFKANKVK